jgi:hypothetical protein
VAAAAEERAEDAGRVPERGRVRPARRERVVHRRTAAARAMGSALFGAQRPTPNTRHGGVLSRSPHLVPVPRCPVSCPPSFDSQIRASQSCPCTRLCGLPSAHSNTRSIHTLSPSRPLIPIFRSFSTSAGALWQAEATLFDLAVRISPCVRPSARDVATVLGPAVDTCSSPARGQDASRATAITSTCAETLCALGPVIVKRRGSTCCLTCMQPVTLDQALRVATITPTAAETLRALEPVIVKTPGDSVLSYLHTTGHARPGARLERPRSHPPLPKQSVLWNMRRHGKRSDERRVASTVCLCAGPRLYSA